MPESRNPLDDWADFESALFSEPSAPVGAQAQVQPSQLQVAPSELQARIEAKQRELDALNEKFMDVDTHYVIKQGDNYVRDTQNLERDRVRRETLRDEIYAARADLQAAQARTQDFLGRFKQAATNYARGNSAFVRSRLPVGLHEAFKKRFNEHLNTYYTQGTFNNPALQTDAMMQGVVESAFNLAFGEVMRQAEARQAGAERGVEGGQQAPVSEDDSWKNDPMAARILARGVGRKAKTLADVMREERERGNG